MVHEPIYGRFMGCVVNGFISFLKRKVPWVREAFHGRFPVSVKSSKVKVLKSLRPNTCRPVADETKLTFARVKKPLVPRVRGKRKEERAKRKEERGKRKEERGKRKLRNVFSVTKQGFVF